MTARAALIAVLVSSSVIGVLAADWPGYLGPKRDGTSTQKGLLRAWPKEGPKVLWTVPLGVGFGGPAVSGGKVYLLDGTTKSATSCRCLDFANGKELWSFAYDAPGTFMYPGSRTTPTVDGEMVYTCGPLGDLYAHQHDARTSPSGTRTSGRTSAAAATAEVGDHAEPARLPQPASSWRRRRPRRAWWPTTS